MPHDRHDLWTLDPAWPCHRLRFGTTLTLFFFFEVFVGQKLPDWFAAILLGSGLALITSAALSIRDWRLEARLSVIRDALQQLR